MANGMLNASAVEESADRAVRFVTCARLLGEASGLTWGADVDVVGDVTLLFTTMLRPSFNLQCRVFGCNLLRTGCGLYGFLFVSLAQYIDNDTCHDGCT